MNFLYPILDNVCHMYTRTVATVRGTVGASPKATIERVRVYLLVCSVDSEHVIHSGHKQ